MTASPRTPPPPKAPKGAPAVVRGLESDAEARQIVEEELRLLETVKEALAQASRQAADRDPASDDARLLELRDDVAAAKPEDLPALFEQMHHLGALRAQRGKGQAGIIDLKSPYFGHIRLDEGGRRRDVLIGNRSYVDSRAGIRVVDWRQAPVSRIYYRYAEGDGYEEELGGRIVEGEVLARRSVSIVGGELVRVQSPQGTFTLAADGQWKRVAVRSTRLESAPQSREPAPGKLGVGVDGNLRIDKHLPAIASMLDGRQFDLISKPSTGLVVVQGSAGSGKTTVGLHRVAYLAFADPNRFRPERMAVVVPHDALRHYVGRVLPSLGVEGVNVTTFRRMSERWLATVLPKLPTHRSSETPVPVIQAKTDIALANAIESLADEHHGALERSVREQMQKWPEGRRVSDALRATKKKGRSPVERARLVRLWLSGKKSISDVERADSVPPTTRSAAERVLERCAREAGDVLGAWDELLTNRGRLEKALASSSLRYASSRIDRIHDWCVRQARIRAEADRDGERPSLDQEDVAILLRLWQRLRGPIQSQDGAPLKFAHLFVDEAQDGTPLDMRVLFDMVSGDRSITLAGDVAQRMLDDEDERGEFSWHALLAALGEEGRTIEPLRVSYRSTAEITAFAREVLGDLAHADAPIPTRSGPPVEHFAFGSVGELVAFVADALTTLASDAPEANVALVTRFAEQADVIFEGLRRAEVPRVRRVAQQDFTWEPGFDVTDIRQTKGLEFDEVLLLETNQSSYPDTPQARHALYVGATRASHQLWSLSTEQPSPIVKRALEVAMLRQLAADAVERAPSDADESSSD